ncbi:uncharacterized protein LOC126585753 isoform X1 [Malus sylvestris]|uniref:uncharacterized protein LOC126585753 isoform X1 n=1 Tax=Malus sylvestris TaxID=3752 RepID=UPI0021AC1AAD|nr:uncharacterized protein LOC126585753 isoform X1 [Malus sylvestris]
MYGKGSMKRNIHQSFQQLEVPSLNFIDLQALIWLCLCSLPPPPTPFSFSSSLCATSKYGGIGAASHSPRHLSLLKQGPSTLRHLQIHCTSPGSVKLVEHELWHQEEKGLIGILHIQDAAEAATLDSVVSR